MKGTLIVLEGTDGSGKSTQFARLCRRLEEEGYPFRRLVFPQYQEESSALIRMYLAGEFGEKPGDVNPGIDFDRKLYIVRREFEQSVQDTYVASLSSRTIVYKGMFLVGQLRRF